MTTLAIGSDAHAVDVSIDDAEQSLRDPRIPPCFEYSAAVRHEIRFIAHVALDQLGVGRVFAEQALSVLDDLPEQWFPNALKIDKINGTAGIHRQLPNQRHLCSDVQYVPDINGQIDITVRPPLARRHQSKKDRQTDPAMRRERCPSSTFNVRVMHAPPRSMKKRGSQYPSMN